MLLWLSGVTWSLSYHNVLTLLYRLDYIKKNQSIIFLSLFSDADILSPLFGTLKESVQVSNPYKQIKQSNVSHQYLSLSLILSVSLSLAFSFSLPTV